MKTPPPHDIYIEAPFDIKVEITIIKDNYYHLMIESVLSTI